MIHPDMEKMSENDELTKQLVKEMSDFNASLAEPLVSSISSEEDTVEEDQSDELQVLNLFDEPEDEEDD